MNKIVSEDAVRRAFARSTKMTARCGCDGISIIAVRASCRPWILDIDTTVKPLYASGRRGDWLNQKPRGRAIPIIPTRWLAYGWSSMSMLSPATSTHPNISRPAVGVARSHPVICGISVAWRLRVRQRADHARSGTRGLAYLFKLRLTPIQAHDRTSVHAKGVAKPGKAGRPRRAYYGSRVGRQRRVIILRRRVKGDLAISSNETSAANIVFRRCWRRRHVYEYSVLATSLDEELVSSASCIAIAR